MEAYYKARRKKLLLCSKQITKLLKSNGSKEQIRALRETYRGLMMETPPREKYMSEPAYLRELKRSVREAHEPFLTLKLDLCYDLESTLEEYDAREKEVNLLRKTQDTLLRQKQEREHQAKENRTREQEKYRGMVSSFLYLDKVDQMKMYPELERMAESMADSSRQVIAYEIEHKDLEYRLTQLYDPWIEVKLKNV
jgi:hypothetical protein